MRQKYRVTYVDPTIVVTKEKNMYREDIEVRYQMFRAVDGTSYNGEPIIFKGAVSVEIAAHEKDIISAEIQDPRQPTYLHEVMLETRYIDPADVDPIAADIAAEAILDRAIAVVESDPAPQTDELAFTINSGYALSSRDVAQLGKRFLKLEAEFRAFVAQMGAV